MILRVLNDTILIHAVIPSFDKTAEYYDDMLEITIDEIRLYAYVNGSIVFFLFYKVLFMLRRIEL